MSTLDINNSELVAFIERIENVEERLADEKAAVKDIYSELKSSGYSPKTVRKIVKDRKQDRQKLEAEQAEYDTYAHAVGLV